MKFKFIVNVPPELSAGLRGFTEEVTIQSDGKYDAETLADALDHFRCSVAEWFDVSERRVATAEEYAQTITYEVEEGSKQ